MAATSIVILLCRSSTRLGCRRTGHRRGGRPASSRAEFGSSGWRALQALEARAWLRAPLARELRCARLAIGPRAATRLASGAVREASMSCPRSPSRQRMLQPPAASRAQGWSSWWRPQAPRSAWPLVLKPP
jgi:hypothetical protein